MTEISSKNSLNKTVGNQGISAPIGIFDSGIGGLSVLRHVREQLPAHPIYYVGDQVHVPYGPRTLAEVREFSIGITRFLLAKGARVIVVACNTASAAALHPLRGLFPDVPFVGMEPAVKPAASHTHSGYVGVLATPATFQSELFASVVERFAQGVTILQSTCPGLVEEIEAGRVDQPAARKILREAIEPMLQKSVDSIVLGCTHYPFALKQIREIAGPTVDVIDPSPAIARQTRRVLEQQCWVNDTGEKADVKIFTSASVDKLQILLPQLLQENFPVGAVTWQQTGLVETSPHTN